LQELDWITGNDHKLAGIDFSLVIKLDRLIDERIIDLDCTRTA